MTLLDEFVLYMLGIFICAIIFYKILKKLKLSDNAIGILMILCVISIFLISRKLSSIRDNRNEVHWANRIQLQNLNPEYENLIENLRILRNQCEALKLKSLDQEQIMRLDLLDDKLWTFKSAVIEDEELIFYKRNIETFSIAFNKKLKEVINSNIDSDKHKLDLTEMNDSTSQINRTFNNIIENNVSLKYLESKMSKFENIFTPIIVLLCALWLAAVFFGNSLYKKRALNLE